MVRSSTRKAQGVPDCHRGCGCWSAWRCGLRQARLRRTRATAVKRKLPEAAIFHDSMLSSTPAWGSRPSLTTDKMLPVAPPCHPQWMLADAMYLPARVGVGFR